MLAKQAPCTHVLLVILTSVDDVLFVQVCHAIRAIQQQLQNQVQEWRFGAAFVQQAGPKRLAQRAVAPFLNKEAEQQSGTAGMW
jgi:hypothetical protein